MLGGSLLETRHSRIDAPFPCLWHLMGRALKEGHREGEGGQAQDHRLGMGVGWGGGGGHLDVGRAVVSRRVAAVNHDVPTVGPLEVHHATLASLVLDAPDHEHILPHELEVGGSGSGCKDAAVSAKAAPARRSGIAM